ncbi:MAG: MFS transporter [Rhizobiales bacterium]|nr:MFS transporter [Hyphomicrobiales bacterium]
MATGTGRKASRAAIASWLLFDWAAQPWFTLVTTFVFGPYFASQLAVDPVSGQALWGYGAAAAGLVIAVLSPVLGAIADTSGARKPWIAGFSALIVASAAVLWLAAPGVEGAVWIALAAFAIGTIGTEFATVFTNAMMPDLVEPDRMGRLSGTGWATGYVGGLISLVLVLGLLVANPATGRTVLGIIPPFGLDAAHHAGDRAAGPFTALWYAVFVMPLFLLAPDTPRRMGVRAAIRPGLRALRDTIAGLRHDRNLARFLVANMVYMDGINALAVFGAIYATSVFGWSAIEIGLFGVLLIVCGIIGSYLGGRLDDRIGAKRVGLGAILLLGLAAVAILSIDAGHVFFVVPVAPPVDGDGLFASAGERVFLAIGVGIGLTVGPVQSASRSLLTRIAPEGRMTQHFGLLALSGRVTGFMGPLAIGLLTTVSGSQRVGISVIAVLFLAGAALLWGVRPTRSAAVSAGSGASR